MSLFSGLAYPCNKVTTRGGQPDYSPLAILTALTLRAVFRLPFRQTEGLIGSVIGLLGLDLAIPDHTTLCRRAETLEVPRPRPRSDGEPVHLLVDSTGLRLCGPGEWLVEKHGTRTRRSWRKLVWGFPCQAFMPPLRSDGRLGYGRLSCRRRERSEGSSPKAARVIAPRACMRWVCARPEP